MNTTLAVSVVGMLLIAALGVLGRRKPAASLEEWTVGGRRFGAVTTWFLNAGEVYTTFTFLGLAGLAYVSGVGVVYALPYLPLAYVGLYVIAPMVWRLGKDRGYLTQGDFFADRYGSRALGTLTAVLGVAFLLPYLQLQITGLGLVVELATGDGSSGTASMVAASVLITGFVLWSGIGGIARAAYLKDALMVIVLVVLVVAIPAHFAGGVGDVTRQVLDAHPAKLSVHDDGTFDRTWFFTSMVTSLLSVMFMTMPQAWPSVLSAKDERALRHNSIWIPFYSASQAIPMLIGFTGILVAGAASGGPNGVLLHLTNEALPDWLVGVVVTTAAACAMVPSAGIVLGMSSLVARNVVRPRSDRAALMVNHGTVVGAVATALVLGIKRPDALANLLLLTYSGLAQMAPALLYALTGRRPLVQAWSAGAGIVAGEAVVIWLTFGDSGHAVDTGHVNAGLIGLAVNIAVGLLVEAALRATGRAHGAGAADDAECREPVAAGASVPSSIQTSQTSVQTSIQEGTA
ncbi:sodium:solute symporter family protein [Yinghuangia seranimata]|uniref:sodium:solute symporter family protein n=1 Tax=Yinghuangia seranimata TaxID=408067 RepID=UPI00248B48CB|nr:sodium:solute symporter family protein [Yinghuangia seranimata]MDI2128450.1 sodium:solute symporter family protein [Yinghuangia seranimata]